MVKIVIARYNEDIHWVIPIIDYVIVYNKGEDDLDYIPTNKIIKCENLGKESNTYLRYIISNYDNLNDDNLNDYIMFIQGKVYDHMYNNDIIKSHNEIFSYIKSPKNYKFKFLSKDLIPVPLSDLVDYCSGIPAVPLKEIDPIPIEKIQCENLKLNSYKFIKKHELTKLIEQCGIQEPKRTELFKLYSHEKINLNNYKYGAGALFICSKECILKHSKDYWEEIYSTTLKPNPSSGYGLEKLWKYLLS